MPRTKKEKVVEEVKPEVLSEEVDMAVVPEIKTKGSITLKSRKAVNGVEVGFERTFTNKEDAKAWQEVFDAVEVK